MKISAIIVNHNCSYLSRLCIEALLQSRGDQTIEIVVADNASSDESLAYLRSMQTAGKIKLVEASQNLGYGRANNLGARHATGEYLLILNPDVVVDRDAVSQMAAFMKAHPDTGMLGPQLYFYNGQIQDSCRRFMSPADLFIKRTPLRRLSGLRGRYERYVMKDFDHTKTQPVDIVTGACIMMPAELFRSLGGFDEQYFLFMEDIDLCRRVWESGSRVVYFPEARALHFHKRLSEGNFMRLLGSKIFWIHVNSAFKYFWKWRKAWYLSTLAVHGKKNSSSHGHSAPG